MTVFVAGIIVIVSMMECCKVMLIVQKNNVKINREFMSQNAPGCLALITRGMKPGCA